MIKRFDLYDFALESNRIEGIEGVRPGEEAALREFVAHVSLQGRDGVEALTRYVAVIQPNAQLRNKPNIPGVRVGNHIAPPSGVGVIAELDDILTAANFNRHNSYNIHCRYETLHPFTDGNGRSGRALWLWMLGGRAPLGFLHTFYYQTLGALQNRDSNKLIGED